MSHGPPDLPIHLVPPLGGLLSTRGGHGKELQPCFTIREDFTERGAVGLWWAAVAHLVSGTVAFCISESSSFVCACDVRSLAIDLPLPETNLPNRLPKGLANQSRQSRGDFDSQDVCSEVKSVGTT